MTDIPQPADVLPILDGATRLYLADPVRFYPAIGILCKVAAEMICQARPDLEPEHVAVALGARVREAAENLEKPAGLLN